MPRPGYERHHTGRALDEIQQSYLVEQRVMRDFALLLDLYKRGEYPGESLSDIEKEVATRMAEAEAFRISRRTQLH
ncbi:MAG: hypothetical protein Greene07147_100 [Parcubacteria group bacterium Greene0714_7]|nr:MAG: hypothetical protein Greene07147_100 [Parcubacteria group bacterium Greene0714_7]